MNNDFIKERIHSDFAIMGIEPSQKKIERLLTYIKLLEKWAKHINLVSARGEELLIKHIYDSLAGLSYFKKYQPSAVFDIGSGAGLPGIPLALFMEDVSFVLVEPRQKRAAFLEAVICEIEIDNCSVANMRLEDLDKKADMITARAFSPLSDNISALLCSVLKSEGNIILYKGKTDKAEIEAKYLLNMFEKVSVEKISVPGLEEQRSIILAENYKL
ncbi:16S rRNA (guanine(527)-N(7))-methyltransferase RsmG [Spirochaetia bacterium 38H-sp]|uniref:Ribosomal RNA small subunit methyltransferase G n=1 Tax=Rarispira pelagica TaxID=3141764 RepID=A0ABU9UA22_9SPIR